MITLRPLFLPAILSVEKADADPEIGVHRTSHKKALTMKHILASFAALAALSFPLSSPAYTIHFNANGGEGTMADQTVMDGLPESLDNNAFTNTNGFFLGWALTPDGNATLLNGDSTDDIFVDEGDEITLYAVWTTNYFANELVARYSFDGTLEGTDLSTEIGAVKWMEDRAGSPNKAVCFDKQTSLHLDNDAGITVTNSFTIAFWAYPESSLQTGLSQSSSEMPAYYYTLPHVLMARNEGNTSVYSGVGVAVGQNGIAATEHASGWLPMPLVHYADYSGRWIHVAVTIDRNGPPKLYVDGRFVKEGLSTSRTKRLSMWGLGGDPGVASRRYAGGVDDFCIFDRALTDEEIKKVMMEGTAYAVRFDANGGEGAMSKRVYASGDDAALPVATFTRDGYTFAGWATSSDGPVVYVDGETIENGFDVENGETITLYARWAEGTYMVHYEANGGTGTMSDQTLWLDIPGILVSNAFSCNDLVFSGWATQSDGLRVYEDGACVTNLVANGESITLYAVWSVAHGLIARYYDISSSGYSTWMQSEAAMTNYFATQTPTISTNTLDFGPGLATGQPSSSPDSGVVSKLANFGMTPLEWGISRFHGKYAIESTEHFAAFLSGYLSVAETGTYSFAAIADDYIVIYVDGSKIANAQ